MDYHYKILILIILIENSKCDLLMPHLALATKNANIITIIPRKELYRPSAEIIMQKYFMNRMNKNALAINRLVTNNVNDLIIRATLSPPPTSPIPTTEINNLPYFYKQPEISINKMMNDDKSREEIDETIILNTRPSTTTTIRRPQKNKVSMSLPRLRIQLEKLEDFGGYNYERPINEMKLPGEQDDLIKNITNIDLNDQVELLPLI